MRLHLTSVEKRHSDKAGDYIQIKGTTPEGEDKTFNIFKQLQPAWHLLKEEADLDLKTVWKGANENVQNIKVADEPWPEDTDEVTPEEVTEKPKATTKAPPKGDNAERVRSMALAYAKDWAVAQLGSGIEAKTFEILRIAEYFASYIFDGVIVEKK